MDEGERSGAGAGRRRKPTFAERREERSRVQDQAIVLAAAARFLETRARSEQEVRRRLADQGYPANLVDGVIERLAEIGLLDDEGFARSWVESRDRSRPRGARVLRQELASKGVAATTVDEIMAERDSPADPDAPVAWGARRLERQQDVAADEAGALRLLARHDAALRRVTDARKRRQRAWALLARNGFDAGLIGDLVRRAAVAWEEGVPGAAGEDEEAPPGTGDGEVS